MSKQIAKVRVNDDTQITYEGTTHRGGETFECEQEHAERFIAAGWATAVGSSRRKSKPKASKDAGPGFDAL